MTLPDVIQIGVLIVAFVALAREIAKHGKENKEQDERNLNKLKIFFLCQDAPQTEQEIIQHFKNMKLGKQIDEVEVRKSIYEMLKDQTLRYRSNGTFKARRNKAAEEVDD